MQFVVFHNSKQVKGFVKYSDKSLLVDIKNMILFNDSIIYNTDIDTGFIDMKHDYINFGKNIRNVIMPKKINRIIKLDSESMKYDYDDCFIKIYKKRWWWKSKLIRKIHVGTFWLPLSYKGKEVSIKNMFYNKVVNSIFLTVD